MYPAAKVILKQILHSNTPFSSNFETDISLRKSEGSNSIWKCCFGCKSSKKQKFPFDKFFTKNGLLSLQKSDTKIVKYHVICSFNSLYIYSGRKIIGIFPVNIHKSYKEIIYLKGCYVKIMLPQKFAPEYYGFNIWVGEPVLKCSRKMIFLANTKSECDDWIFCIQNSINYLNSLEQFVQIQDQIGTGRYSKVYSAIDIQTNQICAVKVVDKAMLNEIEAEMLRQEINIVRNIAHPNIAQFYKVVQSGSYACLISELISGGELFGYINEKQFLKEDEAALITYWLLEAIQYLHENGIVHRDLKPENILIETENDKVTKLKIIDFGLSRCTLPNQLLTEQCGTLSYVAPEVLQNFPYGKAVDLWSVGIILFLMYFSVLNQKRLRGKLPFDSQERSKIAEKTIFKELNFHNSFWFKISESGIFS